MGHDIVQLDDVQLVSTEIHQHHFVLTEADIRAGEVGREIEVLISFGHIGRVGLAIEQLDMCGAVTHHAILLCELDVCSVVIARLHSTSCLGAPVHVHHGVQVVGNVADNGAHAREHALGAVGVLHHGRRLVARAVGGDHHGTVRLQVGGEVDGRAPEQPHLDGTGLHHLHGGGVLGRSDHRDDFRIREGVEQLGHEERGGELSDGDRGAEAAGVHLHAVHEGHELDAIHVREDGRRVQNQVLRFQLLVPLALLQIQVHPGEVHVLGVGQALISVEHLLDHRVLQRQTGLQGSAEHSLGPGERDGLGLRVAQVVAHRGEDVVGGGVGPRLHLGGEVHAGSGDSRVEAAHTHRGDHHIAADLVAETEQHVIGRVMGVREDHIGSLHERTLVHHRVRGRQHAHRVGRAAVVAAPRPTLVARTNIEQLRIGARLHEHTVVTCADLRHPLQVLPVVRLLFAAQSLVGVIGAGLVVGPSHRQVAALPQVPAHGHDQHVAVRAADHHRLVLRARLEVVRGVVGGELGLVHMAVVVAVTELSTVALAVRVQVAVLQEEERGHRGHRHVLDLGVRVPLQRHLRHGRDGGVVAVRGAAPGEVGLAVLQQPHRGEAAVLQALDARVRGHGDLHPLRLMARVARREQPAGVVAHAPHVAVLQHHDAGRPAAEQDVDVVGLEGTGGGHLRGGSHGRGGGGAVAPLTVVVLAPHVQLPFVHEGRVGVAHGQVRDAPVGRELLQNIRREGRFRNRCAAVVVPPEAHHTIDQVGLAVDEGLRLVHDAVGLDQHEQIVLLHRTDRAKGVETQYLLQHVGDVEGGVGARGDRKVDLPLGHRQVLEVQGPNGRSARVGAIADHRHAPPIG